MSILITTSNFEQQMEPNFDKRFSNLLNKAQKSIQIGNKANLTLVNKSLGVAGFLACILK